MRVPRHDDFEDPEQDEDAAEEEDHESEADPAPWETNVEQPGTELDQSTSTVTAGSEDLDVFDSTPQPSRSRSHSRSHSRQGLFDPNETPSDSSSLLGWGCFRTWTRVASMASKRMAGTLERASRRRRNDLGTSRR